MMKKKMSGVSQFLIISELLAAGFLLTQLIIVFFGYDSIPDMIPTHFDLLGEADRFDSKEHLYKPILINVVLYLLLSLLQCVPPFGNNPVKVTVNNREQLRYLKNRLLSSIKCLITAMSLGTLLISAKTDSIPIAVILFILTLLPIVFYHYYLMIQAKP